MNKYKIMNAIFLWRQDVVELTGCMSGFEISDGMEKILKGELHTAMVFDSSLK